MLGRIEKSFICWISPAVLIFLLSVVFVFIKPLACENDNEEWTAYSYKNATPKYYWGDEDWKIIAKKKSYSDNGNEPPYQHIEKYIENLFCTDFKFTDIAVVLLTYCLVIVGWFAMLKVDQTAKRAERAYLVAGPLFGVPNRTTSPDNWAMKNRAKKSMFDGPWNMVIYNFGKTAGYTTKVEWGLCHPDKFPDDRKVTDLLEDRDWATSHPVCTITIQDIFQPTGRGLPFHYRHVEVPNRDKFTDWIFFGRITYKDIFREEHFSTFSYKLVKEHHDSIGKSLSDDHN